MFRKITISKKRIKNIAISVLSVLFFKIALDSFSILIVSGNFGENYVYKFILSRVIESYLLVIISSIFLSIVFYGSNRPSKIAFFIYYFFMIIPLLTIYSYDGKNSSHLFIYMVIFSYFIAVMISHFFIKIRIPSFNKNINNLIFFSLIILSAYVYGLLIRHGGLSRLNFDLYKVYEARTQIDYSNSSLLGYLIPWQAHVINTFFFVFGLIRRIKLIIIFSIALQVLLFGMANFKSFLFAPILVYLLYLFSKRHNLFSFMAVGGVLLISLVTILYFYTNEIMIPSIMFRRLFLTPAENHFLYYNFFSRTENPHIFLSNSFLSHFFSYPYDMPVTRVISWHYFDRDAGLNVGYLGDAYAHFGMFGMVSFSFLLGIFLNLVDCVSSKIPLNASIAIISIPSMALVNSAFFTTLLTHGFLIAFFCLWCLGGIIANKHPIQQKPSFAYSSKF